MFNEFPDENDDDGEAKDDLKSNLTTKINQRKSSRDILVPQTTIKLSTFTLTL